MWSSSGTPTRTLFPLIQTMLHPPGVDEYFIAKWKQIVAATAQAAAARSVIVSASTGAVAVGLGADVED